MQYYQMMEHTYQIVPTIQHQTCVVDALARSGQLADAELFMETHIQEPKLVTLTTLLGACRVYGDVERARRIEEHAIALMPIDSSLYVQLYNIYSGSGLFDEAVSIMKRMEDNADNKIPGRSWITIDGMVHSFVMEDLTHPLTDEINNLLAVIAYDIKDIGYMHDTSFVIQQMEEERKKELLWQHSEKLAVALGLLKTPRGLEVSH